jgi:hypothetical protein
MAANDLALACCSGIFLSQVRNLRRHAALPIQSTEFGEDKQMAIRTAAISALFLGLGVLSANSQTQREGAAPQAPKTTGAMDRAVGGKATSPEDVQRQTEGKPTTAQEGRGERKGEATHPGMTQHSPGTVGAAPGANPPVGHDKK